jgi:hypothetical protein
VAILPEEFRGLGFEESGGEKDARSASGMRQTASEDLLRTP